MAVYDRAVQKVRYFNARLSTRWLLSSRWIRRSRLRCTTSICARPRRSTGWPGPGRSMRRPSRLSRNQNRGICASGFRMQLLLLLPIWIWQLTDGAGRPQTQYVTSRLFHCKSIWLTYDFQVRGDGDKAWRDWQSARNLFSRKSDVRSKGDSWVLAGWWGANNPSDRHLFSTYCQVWKDFEVKHGNEDTLREMLRIKRSVQAVYNTQVLDFDFAQSWRKRLSSPVKGEHDGQRDDGRHNRRRRYCGWFGSNYDDGIEGQFESCPCRQIGRGN